MSAALDTVLAGLLPSIGDAKTAVLSVFGAMIVLASSAWGVLRVLRLFYVSGGEDFQDRRSGTAAVLDDEYEQAMGYAEDEDSPNPNAEAWGEIAEFLSPDREPDEGLEVPVSGVILNPADEQYVEPVAMNNAQWQAEFASRPDIDLGELEFDAHFDEYDKAREFRGEF